MWKKLNSDHPIPAKTMNMKNIIYTLLALSVMCFSSCSQKEDISSPLVGQAINASFSVGGVQTRVNTLDEYANKWENGDKIKAVVTGGGKTSESVLTASVSEDGTTWSRHKNFVWQDMGQHKIYVSYPSDYPYENGTWVLPTDQHTLKGLKRADYIDGSYEGPTANYVNISAAHRLALVTVQYEIGTADFPDGTTLKNPVVLSRYKQFSPNTDGKISTWGGSTSVQAYIHEDANKFSAIIVPGLIGVNDDFLTFSVGEKNYVSTLKERTNFEGGKCYTYNLKVGKNKVELTQINYDNFPGGWTNEEELK